MAKEELINNFTVSVGTTSVVVSEECFQQRSAIIITNTSTGLHKITISLGQEATAGAGIVLNPGGVYQDNRDSGYLPSNKRIFAISDLAAGTLAVQERVLMDSYRG